jgi:hypothetical protein
MNKYRLKNVMLYLSIQHTDIVNFYRYKVYTDVHKGFVVKKVG